MADQNNNTHPGELVLDPADAQPYMEELRDKLLELCLPNNIVQTIEDVEERLKKLYPQSKLIDLAIREANKSRSENHKSHKTRHHSSSSGSSILHNITSFAVPIVNYLLREGVVGSKAESEVSKFTEALIEFIMNDVLNLAGDFVKRQKGDFIITRSDIRTAMHADKDLLDLFLCEDRNLLTMDNHPILSRVNRANKTSLHHNQQLPTLTYKQKVRNMVDSENSFIRGLKLIIKVFKAQLEELPDIRREVQILFCNIDELLELSTLLLTAFEEALESVGQEDEVPFVGSEIYDLAQVEEFQAYFTFAYRRLHPDVNWKKAYLSIVTKESTMTSIRTAGQSFDLAVKHLLPNYLLNTIIQFFEYFKNFSDLYELSKLHDNLDDELALKETISILIKTKKAIEELLDTELDNMEIEPLDPKLAESIRITLERRLDAELQHERNMPLPYMPSPEIYRFSEPDSNDNIQFEDSQNHRTISHKDLDKQFRSETDQTPVIRCATLIKLVERLTYHKYQPNIVDSFLTTYRSFSNPEELLDLLIERFKIPDPPLSVVFPDFTGSPDDLTENNRIAYKHYLKRFRQEYSKPVKMRVINVFKSWIKNHYYDFERHPALLEKLHSFLDEVYNSDKILRSLIVSIKKSIEQKRSSQSDDFEFMLSKSPPPILWWAAKANESEKFDILTLHPVEFARQLTLIEFDLFRAIKPAELMNAARDSCLALKNRNEGGNESSANLHRMTKHFTMFSYWIRKCIVETDDFDKRSAIYNRAIEVMGVLRELNNFTGLLSIGSAIESAAISRLGHTMKTLNSTTSKIIDDYRELNNAHQRKLQNELKKCNPPCIPYTGSYQSWLLQAKEGNKTFIDKVNTSPTLSYDEFHSSFSNSPATPISPKTPMPRTTTTTNPPNSATSTLQSQKFFGGCIMSHRSTDLALNCSTSNNTISSSSSSTIKTNGSNNNMTNQTLIQQHYNQQQQQQQLQQPSTPAPPKMINFKKQRIRANLVAEMSNYQNSPYCLEVQPEIRQFIESIETRLIKFAVTLGDVSMDSTVQQIVDKLDDYLYHQSNKIEPKNCTKPPRSKSKVPDHWKSPGIKVHHNSCATPK